MITIVPVPSNLVIQDLWSCMHIILLLRLHWQNPVSCRCVYNSSEVEFRFSEWTNSSHKELSRNVLWDFNTLFSKIIWQFMLTHMRQYRVLVVVVLGAEGQESGGPTAVANNPEVSLVGLTNRILFPVRGFLYGCCSEPSAMTSLSTLIIAHPYIHTCTHTYCYTSCSVEALICTASPLVL